MQKLHRCRWSFCYVHSNRRGLFGLFYVKFFRKTVVKSITYYQPAKRL